MLRPMPEATLPTAMALLAKSVMIKVEADEKPNTPASSLERSGQ